MPWVSGHKVHIPASPGQRRHGGVRVRSGEGGPDAGRRDGSAFDVRQPVHEATSSSRRRGDFFLTDGVQGGGPDEGAVLTDQRARAVEHLSEYRLTGDADNHPHLAQQRS